MVEIRQMRGPEADALGAVMWDAIHIGRSAYSPAQRHAWLPEPPQGAGWAARLAKQQVWVAMDRAAPVGFLTLANDGYIDLCFVQSSHQGQGVFAALLRALQDGAQARGCRRLWTHASLTAQPAFAARGFYVIAQETVQRSGETLARTEMEKVLI